MRLDQMARILVVDDDPDACELAQQFLCKRGHDVHCASNGRDALSAILDDQPDMVVLDLLMPHMDGPSLLEVIRSYLRFQSLPVVIWTGIQQDQIIARAKRHGVCDVLIKGD